MGDSHSGRPRTAWLPPALGLLFLGVYLLTLIRGPLPADSGEYQVTGALLGVAHPPGYALYTLVSWLITKLLFFLSPATAITVLSAGLAAVTLALVSQTVLHLTGSALAAGVAGAALGLSTTFWAQATTANIRMPTAMAIAWAVSLLVEYQQTRLPQTLAWLALALGIAVSHHGSTVFLAAVLGLYAAALRPRALRQGRIWIMGALPFLAWLYFPLRAGAYGAPPGLNTLAGFMQHILALGFQGDMLHFATVQALPGRLALFANILTFQFSAPTLGLMAAGLGALLWRQRSLGGWILGGWVVHVFIAITYRAPQTVEYLLPAYGLMALALGCALGEISRWATAPDWTRTLVGVLLGGITLLAQAAATLPSYGILAQDQSTRAYAAAVLDAAPPEALILANWHWATPLWYLQQVEGRRPDVVIHYVFPRTASLAQDWLADVAAALPDRPVLVTSFYPADFNSAPYRFVPRGPAWEVRSTPLMEPPAELQGKAVQGDWSFLGYTSTAQWSSRRALTVTAAWSTRAAPEDINFYLHLLGADGQLYGQMDVSHTAARYVTGEVLLDRYTLRPFAGTPAGDYQLVAGAYRPDGTRLAEFALTTIQLPPAAPPAAGIPLGDGIQLLRETVSRRQVHPGETVVVTLEFQSTYPLLNDYTVSVSATGPNYRWRVLADGTPAYGAIPSLKWITGSRITDPHALTIPAEAGAGPATLGLVLYDAFTQQPLPILDRDLAAQGPALMLDTLEVVAP